MWLVNCITPDHGTIAGFVQKNNAAFHNTLRNLTLILKGWGLIDGELIVIDGTKIHTHRIAISNHRIKSMTDTTVTYAVKDYKNEGHWKEKTISGEEFIRRFMMHVPPKRFVRIRHYGLLSCRNKRKKITHCRNLLGCKKYISTLKNLNAVEMIKVLYNIDVCKCSSCGGNMVSPRKDKYSSSFRAHMRC